VFGLVAINGGRDVPAALPATIRQGWVVSELTSW
jgi:hypothetical protein